MSKNSHEITKDMEVYVLVRENDQQYIAVYSSYDVAKRVAETHRVSVIVLRQLVPVSLSVNINNP